MKKHYYALSAFWAALCMTAATFSILFAMIAVAGWLCGTHGAFALVGLAAVSASLAFQSTAAFVNSVQFDRLYRSADE